MAEKNEAIENEKEVVDKVDKKNKKDKKTKKDNKEAKSKGGLLLPLIIGIIIIFIPIFLIKLDIGGFGSKLVGPKIKNIPILNLILPKTIDENMEINIEGFYNFETIDEAIERLKVTEIMLKEKEKEAEELNEILLQNKAEIDRLKVFEANQVQFNEDKKEFDLLVGNNADPESFMAYVEKIYPETALNIYESLVKEKVFDEEVEKISNMYQEMKAKSAAAILQQTVSTDIDMAAQVLLKLDPSQAGAILAAMDSTVADRISRYMYPEK